MRRRTWALPVLISLWVVAGVLVLGTGPDGFDADIWQHLWDETTPDGRVVWAFRMPRLWTATLAGAALAAAGLSMQTLFQNPLAGPDVLGISAGAQLGMALVLLAGVSLGGWGPMGAAVLGAGAVLLLLLAAARRIADGTTLLILGLLVAAGTTALVSILQSLARADDVQRLTLWTMGSVGGVQWHQVPQLALVLVPALTCLLLLAHPLNVWLTGADYAASMGVSVRVLRLGLLAIASVLVGAVTAWCGPIGFIGIAVPHLARRLLRTTDHRLLLPATALTGSTVLLACDWLAQTLLPYPLPLNAVTAVLGAPVVVSVLLRRMPGRAAL